jgi:signal transduction histidine kinase
MLDLWLMVVLFLFVIEMPISYFPDTARFSLGWYTARVIGFLNSGILLTVLLYEITTLYARLLHAIRGQRREREARLLTGDAVAASIAHEVKQPLSGMMTCADAALRFLKRGTPDLDEAKEALNQIVVAGQRASAVIESIRTIFKNEPRHRTTLDLNELIRESLALVQENLKKHRVMVEADLNDYLSKVTGDRIQLQQVLVNLISNAIDSMAGVDGSRLLTVKSGLLDDGNVGASIVGMAKE